MGKDKALMEFRGELLIQRIIRRVSPLAQECFIISNRPEEFDFLDLPVLTDILPGKGALGGLYTALQYASQRYVAVIACDMPFVAPTLLEAQLTLIEKSKADVVVPKSPDGFEPFHSIYRRETCLPAVLSALEAGQRKMISWFSSVNVRFMETEEVSKYDSNYSAFVNLNTLDEFHSAEELVDP
ncbi:MAG: molybdenum cofactor guanylyltransferase [Anaerolineaceae bacterium]|nr:molybdenum cofactor guanylyltransferase [Anaerolineaceae bacterium]